MRKKFFSPLFLFMAATQLLNAQDNNSAAGRFSLAEAQEYALKNSAGVLNAGLDRNIAKAKRNEVAGMGFPQVGSSLDVKDFIELPTNLLPGEKFGGPKGSFIPLKFGTQYNATAAIQASQLIFNSDYLVGLQASKTFIELSEKNYERTCIETKAAVAKAYYTVLVSRERMKLLDANISRLKKLKDDTKVMFDNGFVEKTDLDRIELAFNNILTEKEKTGRLIALSEALLKFQMGFDLNAPLILSDSLNISSLDKILPADTAAFNYSNRVEYSLLQSQLRLNMLDARRNRLHYIPTLVAYGNLSTQAQRNTMDIFESGKPWYPFSIVGATLNVPLFDGLQNSQRIRQASLNVLKTKNSLKNLESAISLELRSSLAGYRNAAASLVTQKKNTELAETIYNTAKAKYEQGVGSSLEIMTAETTLKEAQVNYYGALYDALIAKTDYEKASGLIK